MTLGCKLGILLFCAFPAAAQHIIAPRAGVVQFTAGEVAIGEQRVRASTTKPVSLKNGQVLQTGRGRVEMLLAPSVFLWLGTQSAIRMANTSLEDTLVDVQRGRALIEVVHVFEGGHIRVRLGNTTIEFKGSGLYRFDAEKHELSVFGGEAEILAGDRRASARRGRAVQLEDSLETSKFDLKKTDALHQWAAARSFYLFASNPDISGQVTHWEYTYTGWFWNRYFDKRFYSASASAVYRARRGRENRSAFQPIGIN